MGESDFLGCRVGAWSGNIIRSAYNRANRPLWK
jgi:hypothetical protein